MILNDRQIKELCINHKMIEPFVEKLEDEGVISYGLSSFGYDIRLADEFLLFRMTETEPLISPKGFNPEYVRRIKKENGALILKPNQYVLGRSVEYIRMPEDVFAICFNKSTYARCGLIVNVTPLEPCYDDKTEILTDKGWKLFEDLTDDDLVATLNTFGALEFQKPIARQKIRYTGEMICINNKHIDLCVTPDHLHLVRNRHNFFFELRKVKDIVGRHGFECKRDFLWVGKKEDVFILPDVDYYDTKNIGLNIRNTILAEMGDDYIETKDLYKKCALDIEERTFLHHLYILEKEGYVERKKIRKIVNKHSIGFNLWRKIRDIEVKPVEIPMETWLKFLGAYLSDGYTYISKKGYKVILTCFKKKKVDYYESILKEMPFHYTRTEKGFNIESKQLCLYLRQFGRSYEKYIPKEIKELSPKYLRILIDSLMRGDGNVETSTYTTTSKQLADDIQEIIFKAGYTAIIRTIPPKVRTIGNRPVIGKRNAFKIRVAYNRGTPKLAPAHFSTIKYDGYVYDVTVPNHVIFVRRNGKPCWSSNCWEGYITIEIANPTRYRIAVYPNEGIAQLVFFKGERPMVTYAERKGKYQGQKDITLPFVKGGTLWKKSNSDNQ